MTLNDPVYVEAARTLAQRMIDESSGQLEERIQTGFQRALLRDPSPEEMEVMRTLYKQVYYDYEERGVFVGVNRVENPSQQLELAACSVVANAILNLDEFITKG